MTLAWEIELSAFEKIVLLALADCANDEGKCWPSIATLCRKTNASERTVQRSITALEKAGHLSRRQVVGKGCKYAIHPRQSDTPATLAPPSQGREPPPHGHPTPATVAPKPSMNHQEPLKHTRRACVMPDYWQPVAFGKGSKCAAVAGQWSKDDLEANLEHFTKHHRGKGNRFVDWQDAWETWVLNSRRWGPKETKPPQASNDENALLRSIRAKKHATAPP